MRGLESLGKNYGDGPDDGFRTADVIHVLAPGEYHTTLCGEGVETVAFACSMETGYKPGGFDGCWTCLETANRWAGEKLYIYPTLAGHMLIRDGARRGPVYTRRSSAARAARKRLAKPGGGRILYMNTANKVEREERVW